MTPSDLAKLLPDFARLLDQANADVELLLLRAGLGLALLLLLGFCLFGQAGSLTTAFRTVGLALLVGSIGWMYQHQGPLVVVPAGPGPSPAPKRPLLPPRQDDAFCGAFANIEAKVGGRTAPDGTEIQCDLPGKLHRKNTSSKGAGLCVFTSLHHDAVWHNVPQLVEMPKWMIDKGIAGGGYPSKVKDLIARICKDRGMVEPDWMQAELPGAEALEIMRLAQRCGRMVATTYSKSPTGRYGGSRIAHMVNAVHTDGNNVAILDNNYIGDTNYEWCTPDEFTKICNLGQPVWIVILLGDGTGNAGNPPPPPPKN